MPYTRLTLVTERSRAEAVLFYSDVYEEAASWDHPAQKRMLDEMGIPSAELNKMPFPPAGKAFEAELCRAALALKGGTENG